MLKPHANAAGNVTVCTISNALASHETVTAGYGILSTTMPTARYGRSPRTGQRIAMFEPNTPPFDTGKVHHDAAN